MDTTKLKTTLKKVARVGKVNIKLKERKIISKGKTPSYSIVLEKRVLPQPKKYIKEVVEEDRRNFFFGA